MTDKNRDVVISTRVRFARNINGLPFPHKLSGQEEIYSVLMKNVVECCNKLFGGKFYKTGETEKLFEQSLVEKHLISAELVKKPYGGVFVADDETVSIMINEEDHIREQCIMPGCDLDNAYAKLVRLDELLAQNLDIAFDKYFGYLTACPTNLGAAMRLSAMVSLPALTIGRKMNSLIASLEKIGFTTRGAYGEGTEASGFEYQISNQAAVGKSEESIKDIFGKAVAQIIELERRERDALKQRGGIDLKDKIMRSWGILSNCCKISSSEFMQLAGYVRLGIALGYIGKDFETLDNLAVMTQPAMLCMFAKKVLTAEERDRARAALTNKTLN